jgi:SH3-like domain-containing protein
MKALFITIIALILPVCAVSAEESVSESGLKLPRMVSLRTEPVQVRSGPGKKYPIEWIYQQKGAPVEVINEYEAWREIKDWEGSVSWVHRSMITGKRFAKVTTAGENNIYSNDKYSAKIIAKVEDGAVGEIKECTKSNEFCLLKFDTIEG